MECILFLYSTDTIIGNDIKVLRVIITGEERKRLTFYIFMPAQRTFPDWTLILCTQVKVWSTTLNCVPVGNLILESFAPHTTFWPNDHECRQ